MKTRCSRSSRKHLGNATSQSSQQLPHSPLPVTALAVCSIQQCSPDLPNGTPTGQGGTWQPVVKDVQPGAAQLPKAVPPPGYICHRCFKPGHYKQDCPTLGNMEYENARPAVGIPSDRLRALDSERSKGVSPDYLGSATQVVR